MKKNLQKNTYSQLVKDITELYDDARRALVEAYWRIGKRIVEQERQGETNAIYGDHLLARLWEDLSETLGSGFSRRNIYNMRRFCLAHEENLQHAAKLTWTQHVALLARAIASRIGASSMCCLLGPHRYSAVVVISSQSGGQN